MERNGSVMVLLFLLLFVVVFGPSDAVSLRRLGANPDQNGDVNANQDSASSSPPPPDKTANLPQVEAPKPKDTPTKTGPEKSSENKLDTGINQDGKGSETFASKYCKMNPVCNDRGKTIMACVQDFENDSNNLTLIVQNEQDVDLKVNITFGTSMNNYLPNYLIPAHETKEVNVTISGDKSDKVIINAGNVDCALQISRPLIVNSPSKPKDPENKSSLNNANNTTDSPVKPENNTTDSPVKPEDVKKPADSPTKPKDVDSPTKPKAENDPSKSKEVNTPPKSNDVNAPPKSKDADDLSKSKGADDLSTSRDTDDLSKSKEADNTAKSDASKSTTPSVDTPVSKNNFVDQMTFYSKQVTPMHGAYLAFLIALVIGGSWALCSFRKRRTDGGVPYQELEMGQPTESSNAVDVEAAEGWDQDWDDDDWDEDKAIRSPGGSLNAKTISSNGLTSRVTKKDGWDADWDD